MNNKFKASTSARIMARYLPVSAETADAVLLQVGGSVVRASAIIWAALAAGLDAAETADEAAKLVRDLKESSQPVEIRNFALESLRTHELKSWPVPFEDVVRGIKRFEIRVDDRGFSVGDMLKLCYFDPAPGAPNGGYKARWTAAMVTYIARGWGMPKELCVMGFESLDDWAIAVERKLKDALWNIRCGGPPADQLEQHYLATACRRALRLTSMLIDVDAAKYALGHELRTRLTLDPIRSNLIELLHALPGGRSVEVQRFDRAGPRSIEEISERFAMRERRRARAQTKAKGAA